MEENQVQYLAALAALVDACAIFAKQAGSEGFESYQFVPELWVEALRNFEPGSQYTAKLAAGTETTPPQESRLLQSIFCSVTADGKSAPEKRYWPLEPLALEKDKLFPKLETELEDIDASYQALWRDFSEKAHHLCEVHSQDGDLSIYIESLLLLLQRYTWCIPAAGLSDVSLYDHARMTAALAACQVEVAEEEPVALLVGGDISGVQTFIYTITARGATSALRGRSFYLQLLTEAVARYTLRELNLPATNLIYQGGGGFHILARPDDSKRLIKIQQRISRTLLAHHRGDFYLALGHVPLTEADFYEGKIAKQWDALARRLRRVKQRQFAELAADDLGALFEPQGRGGREARQCQVCGLEHPNTTIRADETVRKCSPCRDYETWGKNLRNARYLWLDEIKVQGIEDNPLDKTPGDVNEVLATFGLRAGISDTVPHDQQPGPRGIFALDDKALCDLDDLYSSHTTIGRRFLVNVTPTIKDEAEIEALREKVSDLPKVGDVKDFSILATQSRGIDRLGVLRMDVDNLGALFAEGFGERASLARTASLSFAVSLYFEGWVGKLAHDLNEAHQHKLYAIYSGGDDLFFVGSWNVVIELARCIRKDLTEFAAHHPGIHASGGLVLVDGKYPLAQAAQEAGEAEHQAKSVSGKNAMNFLTSSFPWSKFEHGRKLAYLLASWIEDEQISKALLQHLLVLHLEWQDKHQGNQPVGPWIWHAVYGLNRALTQHTSKEVQIEIEGWPELMLEDPEFIARLGFVARWAALLVRKT